MPFVWVRAKSKKKVRLADFMSMYGIQAPARGHSAEDDELDAQLGVLAAHIGDGLGEGGLDDGD